jgi:glycosyltransferase involved in cell wall biosynthesis
MTRMKIAIVCSNLYNMAKETANGTAIFNYSLITNLAKHVATGEIDVTVFASGDSNLPVPTESIWKEPLIADKALIASGWYCPYELALIGKAFSMQDQFDVFHVNIGDGDIVLPFTPFVRKPILVTIHSVRHEDHMERFFDHYRNNPNVHFISASNAHRALRPKLNYLATIYHGVDTDLFAFNENGGEHLMWAGRAIPEKGIHHVVEVAHVRKRHAKLFGIPRKEHEAWMREMVHEKIEKRGDGSVSFEEGLSRHELIEHFQTSKAFMLPVSAEEAFGLVLIESMSCGTPVIAFARGAIPEVIDDGKTGFIVNSSDQDIRGDWLIKKTGIDGLNEAVERIYAMPPEEYIQMRRACRERVMRHFTIERMVGEYLQVYKKVTQGNFTMAIAEEDSP